MSPEEIERDKLKYNSVEIILPFHPSTSSIVRYIALNIR